jgi:hypothetical protein
VKFPLQITGVSGNALLLLTGLLLLACGNVSFFSHVLQAFPPSA